MSQSNDSTEPRNQDQYPPQPGQASIPVADNISEREEPPNAETGNGNKNGGFKNWLAHLWSREPDRQLELILALSIALFALIQLVVTIINNAGTSNQVDKIIATAGSIQDSANQIKSAGWVFSGAAQGINNAGWNAVGQLGGQIAETEVSRQSSERQSINALNTATANARADLRAYITVPLGRGEINAGCGSPLNPSMCTDVDYFNVGRTPAIAVKVTAHMHTDHPHGGGGPSVGGELMQIVKDENYNGLEGGIVSNTLPGKAEAMEDSGPGQVMCNVSYHGALCGHTVYGLIQYKDIFDQYHETGFCIYIVHESPKPPQFCDYGNWFDKRPDGYPQRKNGSNKAK